MRAKCTGIYILNIILYYVLVLTAQKIFLHKLNKKLIITLEMQLACSGVELNLFLLTSIIRFYCRFYVRYNVLSMESVG